MPTLFSHPAPALALAAGLGSGAISGRLAVAAVVATLLPDLDVLGFKLGVGYGAVWGHRGFSHSLLMAAAVGCVGALAARFLRCGRLTAFLALAGAYASHLLLDAMTTGGLGVAALWPFDNSRYFLPWRPIAVSPFSPRILFSERGSGVMLSELQHIWLPCALFALLCFIYRALYRKPGGNPSKNGTKPAATANPVCPSRSGNHTGRCPCPSTSKGLRPEGCGFLQAQSQVPGTTQQVRR